MGLRSGMLRRPRGRFLALFAVMAAIMLSLLQPASALADAADEQEVTPFYFGGVITFDSTGVPDVGISIDGNGFRAETATDADGRWRLYVPEKATYTLTVDESTLPEGVIVEGDSASQEVEFGLTGTKIINLFLGEGMRETTSFVDQLISRTVGGINFGLLLGLAAMGAALIYGTTRLSNFAHGEMVTWGGFIAVLIAVTWQLPLWLGIGAAVLAGALLGWGMDAGLWRPLRRRGMGVVQLLIVSIGLSLALRYVLNFFMGGGTHHLPGANPEQWRFGPISLSYIDLVGMGVSLAVILGMAYFLSGTRVGRATRAISDNPQLASASGINVDNVIRTVWILAGALAAISGVLWTYFRPGVKWDMGMQMLLLMFCAITLGGLGSAIGALIGSIIVGIAVEVSTLWIPSDLKYASALLALVVVLLVRPQGMLGRKERLG